MSYQTGFEATGGARWTTRDEEATLLQALDAATKLSLDVAGYSVQGNPIWRASIGAGSTIMVVANVHGNEPSGRDSALSWLRDLATSTSPDVTSYLAGHRVVVIPNLNVDGSSRPRLRENANGADLNRDYMSLRQPETRAVARTAQEFKPVVILDMHEVGDDEGHIWRPWWDAPPGAHPDLLTQAQDAHDHIVDRISEYGTSHPYATSLVPWGGLSTIAGAWHAAGILSEVAWRTTTLTRRHAVNYRVLDALREYHAEHTTELDAARAASEAYEPGQPIRVPTHARLNQGAVVTVPGDTVYPLTSDAPLDLLELHGIVHDGQSVDLDQPARLMAAWLLAPESSEQITTQAEWSPHPEGSPVEADSSVGYLARVSHQGATYPTSKVWVQRSGQLVPVRSALVKTADGLRPVAV